jgi:SAM-dependent methyltransferase
MARIVAVPRFNTILDDRARQHYLPATKTLWSLVPDMMKRKIPAANVQQSFMLAAVLELGVTLPRAKVLCVGCFEDTAYESLLRMGYSVEGLDPNVDGRDLSAFVSQNPASLGTYDVVFSTSVIEHVEDDEQFVSQIAALLREGGVAILTCDFLKTWRAGQPVHAADYRFYTPADLRERLVSHMPGCFLVDEGDWENYDADFSFEGFRYNFASFAARKDRLP